MAKFHLNLNKQNNYAFFCPKSKLHLTVSNPAGSVSEVTPAIIRAVKSKVLIDVDGVVNKDNRVQTERQEPPKPVKQQEHPVQQQKEESPIEEQVTEKKIRKRSKKVAEPGQEQAAETETKTE